jgi:hypothetical protein
MPDSSYQIVAEGVKIQRNKIPDYRSDDLGDAIEMWQIWENKNLLPYPGTWREQPAHVWDVLKAFDAMYATYMKEKAIEDELAAKSKAKRH